MKSRISFSFSYGVGYGGFFALVYLRHVRLCYVRVMCLDVGCGICVHNVLHIHIYSLSIVEYDDDVDDVK